MPKFIKGSEEAKEQAKKMREARGQKDNGLLKTLVAMVGGIEKRLVNVEECLHTSSIPNPSVSDVPSVKEEAKEPEGLELLPFKAREILKAEFPEAKIVSVVPWAKGGFAINIDVTHLTGGYWDTAMIGGKQTRIFTKDIRDIPVKAMEIEKSMKERIKKIKQNMGWIKKEATPEFVERELKPAERPLPQGIDGTPEAEFFTRNVE